MSKFRKHMLPAPSWSSMMPMSSRTAEDQASRDSANDALEVALILQEHYDADRKMKSYYAAREDTGELIGSRKIAEDGYAMTRAKLIELMHLVSNMEPPTNPKDAKPVEPAPQALFTTDEVGEMLRRAKDAVREDYGS